MPNSSNFFLHDLKHNLISTNLPSVSRLKSTPGYYDLVWCPVTLNQDADDNVPQTFETLLGHKFLPIFTQESLIFKMAKAHSIDELLKEKSNSAPFHFSVKQFMLGDLVQRFGSEKAPLPLFVNPIKIALPESEGKIDYWASEIVFAPLFDLLTKKYMMTKPDEALALLAMAEKDQARFGIELVFHLINNVAAPEEKEEREKFLQEKMKELSFVIARTPIKKGSASFYCVILNLENSFEETAFIRPYKTLDSFSNVIFVNSNVEILTGDLSPINYDGNHIDTIFGPMIEWQKAQKVRGPGNNYRPEQDYAAISELW